jgi:putative ABC transport system substrate-binding protein
LKQLAPVKKLAVLYTTGEKNSESQLKELQETQADFQIKVVPVPLSDKAAVAQIIPEVCGRVDAIYLSGSNVVAETAETIVNVANTAKVITVAHLDSLVEKGALLGVYADPFSVGRLAGEKAVKILKGAKPSSIPIEMLKKVDVIVNMKAAKAGGFQIPPAFMKSVTKVIE